MSTLHPLSHGTPLSEFDIFSVPPTQLSVVNDIETEHRPIQPISVDRLAQFEFSTAPREYVKWTDTELYIKLRIKLTPHTVGQAIKAADWSQFVLEKNFMHTMIQSLDLSINGRVVTKSSISYPYRAYLDNLIGYSDKAKSGHMTSTIWQDYVKTGNSLVPRYYPSDGTKDCSVGDFFELRGKLCLDISQQGRAMLGGCTYKIELRFNKPEMAFRRESELKADIDWEISNLSLLVHRSIVSEGTLTAHTRALQHATAKYPITRHEVQTMTISAGMMDVQLDRIFTGQLPRRVLVGFVKASAFRGSYTDSTFQFDNFNINHLSFNIDGQSYPRSPYMPDFTKRIYMREYYTFLQTFNQDTTAPVFSMSYDDFIDGQTFFCYNFAPDLGDGCGFGGYLSLIKSGSLGLHVRFAAPSKEAFVAIIFAEFDNLIQIDKNLQVSTDYII
jgi:hypothetical protein